MGQRFTIDHFNRNHNIGVRWSPRKNDTWRHFLTAGFRDKRGHEYYHPVIGLTVEGSLGWSFIVHVWWKELYVWIH